MHAHTMMHWLERTSWEEAEEPKVISFPTSPNILSLGSTIREQGSGRIQKWAQEDGLWRNGINFMEGDGVVVWKAQ